jgi:hypothetical protein
MNGNTFFEKYGNKMKMKTTYVLTPYSELRKFLVFQKTVGCKNPE